MTITTEKNKKIVHKSQRLDFKNGRIELTHGSGGRAMTQLIEQLFLPAFQNEYLLKRNDQACFLIKNGRMVMTTDAYVITPLFFPGGDIGSLSINGTINDIAMAGAMPMYLTVSFIIEEGFLLSDLKQIIESMAITAKNANVKIIAGDTKVVERGKGDGIFITTTGVGIVPENIVISAEKAQPGDCILISGAIGEHGVTIMSKRNNLQFHSPLQSDTAALHELVAAMIKAVPDIHCLRDPTRGGLATVLNEFAMQSQVGMCIDETAIPIHEAVAGACELLGLDPLYIANEGKLVAICAATDAELLLNTMQSHLLGREASIIGHVIEDPNYFVQLKTKFGGMRLVDWLTGEQLPRIC